MYFPPPQKLYPQGLAGAPHVAGAGGAWVGLTGAWVAAAGGAVALGVGAGVGLAVGVGLGVAVAVGGAVGVGVAALAASGLVVEAVPPPTPPVPDLKLVALEDGGVSAAAHPHVETKRTATMAQPATAVRRFEDPRSGSLDRISQAFDTRKTMARTTSPKTLTPGLPLSPARTQMRMAR